MKDYTGKQKIKKKFWEEPVKKTLKNLAQASESPITIPTVSNHLGFLKDDSRKPGNCENSSYEQALRHFYIGIERVNTHVD